MEVFAREVAKRVSVGRGENSLCVGKFVCVRRETSFSSRGENSLGVEVFVCDDEAKFVCV